MKLTMLGTGNAFATECFNTCFVINDDEKYFMVDGGGGNVILRQFKYAGIDWKKIHHIFVTHRHVDHILGVIWMTRMICQFMNSGEYVGDAYIYGHGEVIDIVRNAANSLLIEKQSRFVDDRLHLVVVEDGDSVNINGRDVTFFDIQSKKTKQFGFTMEMDGGEKLTCCGDEPFAECERKYAENSRWLLHEAYCLHSQADHFKPYEKSHSTVKDAAELAEELGVKNLLLYHTEDENIKDRKVLYTEEAKKYFGGNVFVPEDLETLEL